MGGTQAPRLIGYRRVSTAGQLDGYGLPAQLADLKKYTRGSQYRLAGVETDGAVSGTVEDRPALLSALKAIESGQADGLLLPGDLDRLARELVIQEAIITRVWKLGGIVVTTTRGVIEADDPDDPMRTALRQFMGVVAQLDRALVVKRMRNGRKAKAQAGGYAGYGSPAYGMRTEDHELVPDAAQQAAISRIRELRTGGASMRGIADQLNAEGIVAKRGGTWSSMTVRRVLVREGTP